MHGNIFNTAKNLSRQSIKLSIEGKNALSGQHRRIPKKVLYLRLDIVTERHPRISINCHSETETRPVEDQSSFFYTAKYSLKK